MHCQAQARAETGRERGCKATVHLLDEAVVGVCGHGQQPPQLQHMVPVVRRELQQQQGFWVPCFCQTR